MIPLLAVQQWHIQAIVQMALALVQPQPPSPPTPAPAPRAQSAATKECRTGVCPLPSTNYSSGR